MVACVWTNHTRLKEDLVIDLTEAHITMEKNLPLSQKQNITPTTT